MLRRTPIKKFSDKKLAQLKAQGITNPTSTFTGQRKPLPKSKKKIKPVSKKEAARKKAMHVTYEDMDQNIERVCSGCGSGQFPLSHSHILSQYKYPWLKAHARNIVFDCLSIGDHRGCHDIWESGTTEQKMKLLNYQARMDFICEMDVQFWHRLKNKEEEVSNPI